MSYSYPHPVPWTGKDLKGTWHFTIKIDGVRMLRDAEGKPISRNGKPLYNLEHVPVEIQDAEIYYGDWETSISHVRSSVTDVGPVHADNVFSLFPAVDKRLDLGLVIDPTSDDINKVLELVLAEGYEGLVIREIGGKGKLYKVKPHETYDVQVTGMIMGTGKHEGRMGALYTPMGKVGTGFTDKQREEWYEWFTTQPCVIHDELSEKPTRLMLWTGAETRTIEVECWELTKDDKFRHPRYIRLREDK